MHAKLYRVLVTVTMVTLTAVVATGSGRAEPHTNEFFPLSKVRRGQKGYGLTTIQGTTPERFSFEVIGVNRNFLPKMDIILVKSNDPKVQVTGFWQGMSGSPLYIEGKLVCAFSYGFRFNKQAIGGCTPLSYMKEEGFRSRRASKHKRRSIADHSQSSTSSLSLQAAPRSASSLAHWLKIVPDGDIGKSLSHRGKQVPWILRDNFPHHIASSNTEIGMQPAAVPLALSGFTPPAFAKAKQAMSGFPLEPMQAGGSGSPNRGPTKFQMGSAIAVQLIRGDMSAAATGTVSFVDGNDVLAFGHPLFTAGEIYAPVAAAEVHTVIPSAQNAFVIASPLRELGSLTQDRQSTIAADTGFKVRMIPVHIGISSQSGQPIGDFDVEVVDNRLLTTNFAGMAVNNAASLYLPDKDSVTVNMTSKVSIKGHKPLVFRDFLHSEQSASEVVTAARGLRALTPLLNNPFGPVEIEAIDLNIKVAFDTNAAEIVSISVPTSELIPGKKNYARVTMKPKIGKKFSQRIPFDVPSSLAGSIVRLEIISGDSAPMHIAPPESVKDLIAALRTLLPGTVYAITLYSADEGAAIGGRLIHDLPSSAVNRLRAATRTQKVPSRRAQSRSLYPAKRVIEGNASLLVKIGSL